MNRTADFSNYPLPEALARRVVTYLNFYRLFVSFYLTFAFFGGLLNQAYFLDTSAVTGTILISYVVMAVYLAIEGSRPATPTFFLAKISLVTDILFLSALLFLIGGPESGLTVLLIFASASAAILFPLRLALFLASLVVLDWSGGERPHRQREPCRPSGAHGRSGGTRDRSHTRTCEPDRFTSCSGS